MKVAPFPWQTLDRLPRELPRRLRDLRSAAGAALDPAALSAALASVVGAPARVLVLRSSLFVGEIPHGGGLALSFANREGSLRVGIEVDRDLAMRLVALALGPQVSARLGGLADPRAPLPAALAGAVSAVIAQVARRAHGSDEALRPLGPGVLRAQPGERFFHFDASVTLGDEAFVATATVLLGAARLSEARAERSDRLLRKIGDMPIELPVIGAYSLADRAELAALRPGDAWMPGRWLFDGNPRQGTLALAAPRSSRAVLCRLDADGKIVVLGVGPAPLEPVENAMNEGENQGEKGAENDTVADAVLDAPVVVRVEIGAVTLTAHEWAELAPGDVLSLGRRVGEPAVLRVAGVEVASGDLVDIEGELGVRIRSIRPPSTPTKANA